MPRLAGIGGQDDELMHSSFSLLNLAVPHGWNYVFHIGPQTREY